MIGIECHSTEIAQQACATGLKAGVILLPSGDRGNVISITPPLCIDQENLLSAIDIIVDGITG